MIQHGYETLLHHIGLSKLYARIDGGNHPWNSLNNTRLPSEKDLHLSLSRSSKKAPRPEYCVVSQNIHHIVIILLAIDNNYRWQSVKIHERLPSKLSNNTRIEQPFPSITGIRKFLKARCQAELPEQIFNIHSNCNLGPAKKNPKLPQKLEANEFYMGYIVRTRRSASMSGWMHDGYSRYNSSQLRHKWEENIMVVSEGLSTILVVT